MILVYDGNTILIILVLLQYLCPGMNQHEYIYLIMVTFIYISRSTSSLRNSGDRSPETRDQQMPYDVENEGQGQGQVSVQANSDTSKLLSWLTDKNVKRLLTTYLDSSKLDNRTILVRFCAN